jgi:4-amino-4-deoxy-L-arabinose transferase-like glycosyltransferase
MKLYKKILHPKFGIFVIFVGFIAIALAILISPTFASNYLSPDHNLSYSGIRLLNMYRIFSSLVGTLLIISGYLIRAKERMVLQILEFLHNKIDSDSILFASLICAWLVLYLIYLKNHPLIPDEPGGFYLESARQLAQNRFLIPAYVKGFGLNGIPFAYPPLAFYVLAVMGFILGGILKAALIIPGILLLIQAILMYFFMKQWTGSKQASLWAALVLLFMPQIFSRTIFADGITTGLAGIFLLCSWIVAIKPIGKSNIFPKSVLGGVFVGLSILSHPAIGLFCSVTYTILYLYQNGFSIKAIKYLISTGLASFFVILPWLISVISAHGIAPLLAGLKDSKSSLGLFGNTNDLIGYLKNTFDYIYIKHISDSNANLISFLVFPFILAIINNIIKGPRILILLLVACVVTMRGHPSVTMFVLAASIGIFYDCFLYQVFVQKKIQTSEVETGKQKIIGKLQFLAFYSIHLVVLFILCFGYISSSPFNTGEQETFNWIRVNTQQDSTFITEINDEALVYFGQRTILLPTLGAEWVPDAEYGNGLNRNTFINEEIFNCREIECLYSIFSRYSLTPDYIIYRISDSGKQEWIDKLNDSCLFDIAYKSGNVVTLHRSFGYDTCSWDSP